MPTLPEASITKGVESLSPVSSLTLNDNPVPKLVIIKGTAAEDVPVWAILTTFPVFEAFEPDKTNSARFPVNPVEVEDKYRPFPEVKELALMVKKV